MADTCVLHFYFFPLSPFFSSLSIPNSYILGTPKSAIRDGEGGLFCDFIVSSLSLLPLACCTYIKRALLVLWLERELYTTRPLAPPFVKLNIKSNQNKAKKKNTKRNTMAPVITVYG